MDGENAHTPLNDLALSDTDQRQELWLASDLWAYNFSSHYYLTSENSLLPVNRVNHLHFNNRQGAFFATPEGLSMETRTTWINYTGMDDLYLDYEITDMGTASNGYTYVTTYGGGVERFTSDVDGISGATVFDTDWSQLESDYIHTVFIDDTLQVYGTDMGVAMHFSEYTKWDWQVYTTSDGLINDTVLAVLKDHTGHWWFGTPGGISRFDGSSWTSYTAQSHDMISNQILFLAIDIDGSVWMAAHKGLSQFTGDRWISYPK